jgi:hypothetical protein
MITEAYVAGLNQETARKLLDRANELGLPASVVRTVDGGFIVPAVLVDDPGDDAETNTPEPDAEPDDAPEPETENKAAAPKAQRTTRRAATKSEE